MFHRQALVYQYARSDLIQALTTVSFSLLSRPLPSVKMSVSGWRFLGYQIFQDDRMENRIHGHLMFSHKSRPFLLQMFSLRNLMPLLYCLFADRRLQRYKSLYEASQALNNEQNFWSFNVRSSKHNFPPSNVLLLESWHSCFNCLFAHRRLARSESLACLIYHKLWMMSRTLSHLMFGYQSPSFTPLIFYLQIPTLLLWMFYCSYQLQVPENLSQVRVGE